MNARVPARVSTAHLPALVATSGESAARRFVDFFTSNIRNRHTREAYGCAVSQFLAWCETQGVRSLSEVQPIHVAAWTRNRHSKHRRPPSSSGSPQSAICSIGWW
jgi:site-specific recombinase XerD